MTESQSFSSLADIQPSFRFLRGGSAVTSNLLSSRNTSTLIVEDWYLVSTDSVMGDILRAYNLASARIDTMAV